MALTPKERANLRSLAHHLKPIHYVGREGITDAAVAAVAEAFNQRELLKVKVQQGAPISAQDAGAEFAARIPGVEHVQTIGRTVVLYRERPLENE